MGSGHMGTDKQNVRQTRLKHYFPTTSLAGGNKRIRKTDFQSFSLFILSIYVDIYGVASVVSAQTDTCL